MKKTRLAVIVVVLLFLSSALSPVAYAAKSVSGQVTIHYYREEEGPSNSGSSSGGSPSNSSSSSDGSGGRLSGKSSLSDNKLSHKTVSILKPEIPRDNLGTLPKTGGEELPMLLICAGTLLLVAFGVNKAYLPANKILLDKIQSNSKF